MRAMGHLRGSVDETMDLTYNQYKALLSLSDMGPDRLVAMGLVERAPAEADRRSIVLVTSTQGEELLEKVKENILRRYQDLFHHLGPAEQANLAGAIHSLVRILEKARHREENDK
jgi:DNA-binding MarR family transcriptional regulator